MALRTGVLIVGAGPAGLALAIELGGRSIPCLVAEKNERVGHAPRAKTTHVRTRELLRRWGIAADLAAHSPLGIDYPSDILFVTRLAGHRLARFENAFSCAPEKNDLYSEHAQWVPQYVLEEVLRAHAESLPSVEFRFNCEFLSASQDETGVRSKIKDLARQDVLEVTSRFLVGADGARSAVRDVIGAKMEGAYGLSRNYNVVFRAPGLAEAHRHGKAIMYWQVNSKFPSLIGPMDTGDRWFFMPTGVPDDATPSHAEAADMIRTATGIDLPYEVLSADEWTASRFIADRYRDRRIFLIGDACHLHPPFGGYGMNMGIADSVDLGWKLASFIDGWGGAATLDSYELERRPVHRELIDEAVANHALLSNQLWREGLDDDSESGEFLRKEVGDTILRNKGREFHNLGFVLGYRYSNSPIIITEGAELSQTFSQTYVPSDEPGCIAPHMWLEEDKSLYDLFGPGFTLLAFGDAPAAELSLAAANAAALEIPFTVVQLDDSKLRSLYRSRYTLIRPDQHIAWRGNSWLGPEVLKIVSGNKA